MRSSTPTPDGADVAIPSPLTDRRIALWTVALVAGLVFANSLGNRFAYDDQHIVVTNESIQSLQTLPGAIVRPYWPGDYGRNLGLWRPATTAVLGLEYVAGGGAPWVFHAFNVLAHVAATVLVLLLLAELMPLAAAFIGTLVFAVHPIHVEAVANVIGVAEIVSSVALLLACLLHLRGGATTGWGRALGIGALYALGFGAKESAVTLPGLLFLLDCATGDLGFRALPGYVGRRWKAYVVMAIVAGALLTARFAILGSIANPLGPLGGDLLKEVPRIWTLGEVWTHYVRLWVFPLDLSSDYSPAVIPISVSWHATNALGVLLALGVLATSLWAWRKPELAADRSSARVAAFGVVWFIIAISPVSNTVFLSGVLLAERTFYLPSVGLAAATGWLVVRLARERPRVAWGALALAIAASGVRTWTRTPTWYDSNTVMATLIDEVPYSGRAQWALGDIRLVRGQVSDGLRSYRAAIDLLGTHYQLLTEMADMLLKAELYRPAEALLVAAAENDPQYPLAHGLLALIRSEHGDAPATERYARASLERWEDDPTRYYLLAWALAAQGRFDEAAAANAKGLEQGDVRMWQRDMYRAYVLRSEGDSIGAAAAVDAASSGVATTPGRAALDSVRVSEFGLAPRFGPPDSGAVGGNR